MSLVNSVLFVIVTWWLGTGVVLYLQQRIKRAGISLVLILAALTVISLLVLKYTAGGFSSWHSYAGFIAAVVLWGCLELSYYTGLVSGTHKRHCPENCSNSQRFRMALGTSIWHEISVLCSACIVIFLCWQAVNPAGLYTFLVLWLMRWSAKLNLFFGMPNFNTDWFPDHLSYAHSYIRRSRVSLFFPLSVTVATAAAIGMMIDTMTAQPLQALATALPCVLLMLAILEHVFMALPVSDSALWNRVFARDNTEADHSLTGCVAIPDDHARAPAVTPLMKPSFTE